MMKEIHGVSAEPDGPACSGAKNARAGNARAENVRPQKATTRRWFHDDTFDLFVWQGPGAEVVSFQLCYGVHTSEEALVWNDREGFFHDGPARKAAGTGAVAPDPILQKLDSAARQLPADVREPVMALVREYAGKPDNARARRKRFRRADWQKLESQA